jgi:hypothetical protein
MSEKETMPITCNCCRHTAYQREAEWLEWWEKHGRILSRGSELYRLHYQEYFDHIGDLRQGDCETCREYKNCEHLDLEIGYCMSKYFRPASPIGETVLKAERGKWRTDEAEWLEKWCANREHLGAAYQQIIDHIASLRQGDSKTDVKVVWPNERYHAGEGCREK